MIRNYFKTAFRSFIRNRNYTIINIAGMAVGIAVCLVIFVIIQFHTSYDNFHANKDRVFRVVSTYQSASSGNLTYSRDVPFPLPEGIKTTFPDLEQVAPVFASHNDQLLLPGEDGKTYTTFKEDKGVFFTTPSLFKMLDFSLLAGSFESLKDPNTVLLSRETAERYFGNWKEAIGKTIILEAGGSIFSHSRDVLKVTGILASIPANTDFQFKMVVSYGTGITEDMSKTTDWKDKTNADFGCFLMLPGGMLPGQFNSQLEAYSRKMSSGDGRESQFIQALSDIHYDTRTGNYSNQSISHELMNVLWLIAAFILLIACVNFVNLSTAQAVNRAKEVGVRKVLGGSKSQLKFQFLAETLLIVISAVILAVLVTVLSLPYISRLLGLTLRAGFLESPAVLLFLLLVTVIVTALAGFYPSLVLSRFNPITVFKSKQTIHTTRGISLRRGLVVFQFIIAQALIIGTLVIVKQMNFFMEQPLGFDKEAIINVPFRTDSLRLSRLEYLKERLLTVNGVQAVSFSSNTPVEEANDMWSTFKFDHSQQESSFKAITKFADDGFLSAYKLQLVAGRNLTASDWTREFLVNESMMKSLGYSRPEDILNKEISMWGDRIKCPVVGVMKDFNNRSLRDGLAPLLIATNVTMYNQAGIKLETSNLSSTLEKVKKIWEDSFPNFVYEYRFLDEKIEQFYRQEAQLAQLYKIFAAIAIFLSCLGLYGLASFMAVQRIKEVGIRKVLGASASNIVYLFSKEFIVLISIAFLIATPIAWYFMNQWLQDYVYRIRMGGWVFAAGGVISILIALATISFQAIRAALANPVKSLRNE